YVRSIAKTRAKAGGMATSVRKKDVRAGATAPRTSLWMCTLLAVGLSGKERRPGAGLKVRKVRETALAELLPQALGRDPDRRLRATGEREEHVAARRCDAGELVEEWDHVRERDKVEGAGRERQVRGVRDLETHSLGELRRCRPAGLGDHLLRDVRPHDARCREAAGDREGREAGAGAEVEHALRLRGQGVERLVQRREGVA